MAQGDPLDSILSCILTEKIDIVVIGTHGRCGFDRLLLGSTTDRVMRSANCPVLIVPKTASKTAGSSWENQAHRLDHVLLCTDFSHDSERALAYAISAAEEYNAKLTLLNVIESVSRTEMAVEVVTGADQRLSELASVATKKDINAIRVGTPYKEIINYILGIVSDSLL